MSSCDIPGKKNPCFRETPINNLSQQDIEGIQVLYGVPAVAAGQRKGQSEMVPASHAGFGGRRRPRRSRQDRDDDAGGGFRRQSLGQDRCRAKAAAAAFSEVVAAVKDVESRGSAALRRACSTRE